MKKHHKVDYVSIEKGILRLTVDGKAIQYELKDISPLLANAKDEDLKIFKISPSGYGIHWPLIDEDISVDALIGIVHKPNKINKSA